MIDVINVSLVECDMNAASRRAIDIAGSRCGTSTVRIRFLSLEIERTPNGDMFTYRFIITEGKA